ncbi:MAG: NADH-quinone oxidoreductase subunit N [Alphaproteobacteria bacterium]|nr:NADH-quinone oxidoreductase subunit N [Alphaproteobacteria bacterium]
MQEIIQELMPILPEMLLLTTTVFSLIAAVYAPSSKAKRRADNWIYAGLISAFIILCSVKVPEQGLFIETPSFVLDRYAVWLKKLVLPGALVCLAFGSDWLKYKKYSRFEFAPLVGFSVTGMMLTISGGTFLMQFLGLEMMYFPLLFLTAYKRLGERSTEAGTKYAVMVFLSSGLYLFGVSVIYACLGTMDFSKIAAAEKTEIMPALLWGLSFIAAGLLLKIGAAPFHSWAADVYEGAPSPVTALFMTVVRLSVIAAFVRIVLEPFGSLMFYWKPFLMGISVLSLGIGGFEALVQENIKRLAAYTVIGLNGFSLAVLILGKVDLLLLFLTADLISAAGFSAIILSLRIGDELSEKISVLKGQGRAKPARGALFSLIFLGMSGAPPFVGFWARFQLFKETTLAGHPLFAVLLMLGELLVMYVYFRLIRQMYTISAKEELSFAPAPMKAVILFSAFLSVFFFAALGPLGTIFQSAALGLG